MLSPEMGPNTKSTGITPEEVVEELLKIISPDGEDPPLKALVEAIFRSAKPEYLEEARYTTDILADIGALTRKQLPLTGNLR